MTPLIGYCNHIATVGELVGHFIRLKLNTTLLGLAC